MRATSLGYSHDLHAHHLALLHSIIHCSGAQEWGINGFPRTSCPSLHIMEKRLATCAAHVLFRPAVSTFTLYGDNSGISDLWHPAKDVLLVFLASSLFWYLLQVEIDFIIGGRINFYRYLNTEFNRILYSLFHSTNMELYFKNLVQRSPFATVEDLSVRLYRNNNRIGQ